MSETLRQIQPFLIAGAFLALWLAEAWVPRHGRARPWCRHAALNLFLNVLYLGAGIIFSAANMYLARWVEARQMGLLHWVRLPEPVEILIGILVLDFAAYVGHVLKHKWPLFWRFHQVHHSDRYLDVTSGFRFHPMEAFISWLFLFPAIVLGGIPTVSILIFAVMYAVAALAQHANVRLPSWLDRVARLAFVSPAFHRVHHSPYRERTDSNYSTLFSFWDRIFGTCFPAENDPSDEFGLGLPEESCNTLCGTLLNPFKPPSAVKEDARMEEKIAAELKR